jgi:hypothetical protein
MKSNKAQDKQPQPTTLYLSATNDTDWDEANILKLQIYPTAVKEIQRMISVLEKEFSEYEFGISLNIFMKGVHGEFSKAEDQDYEILELDGVITALPDGYEFGNYFNVDLYHTEVRKDGDITFVGRPKHGDGTYEATININKLLGYVNEQ